MRIKFKKNEQKNFLDKVIHKISSPSLRGLLQFGIDTNYDSLKNYYTERRLLPEELFLELCHLAKINQSELMFEVLEENWGKIKGGKVTKKKAFLL